MKETLGDVDEMRSFYRTTGRCPVGTGWQPVLLQAWRMLLRGAVRPFMKGGCSTIHSLL
ncbi:MAG: hypothetical protein PVG14_20900 [Anaerolineales bacterium]